MAVEQMNDSYRRCLAELRQRYGSRGFSVSVRNEASLQQRQEETTRALAPESYVVFDAESKIADFYRSGEYKGSKYMTSSDFVRYFRTRRAPYSSAPQKESVSSVSTESHAVSARGRGVGNRSRGTDSNGKEGHLATAISALKELAVQWFPVERREGRAEGKSFRMPVSVLSGMAVFAVSLGLIVGGSVMLGNASGEVGRLNSTIVKLEAQQTELQGKLDLKYNVDEIEAEAKSLGMINRQYADNEYVTVNEGEQIIIYEEGEDQNVGLSALLASFGIELD